MPLREQVRIVHEDDDLVVVEKPAGLLTIATPKERKRTLYAFLWDHVKARDSGRRIFIVHRLDREASGLLVLAKSLEAKQALQEQFRQRRAGRAYLARVEGAYPQDSETLRSYLAENAAFRVYSTDGRRGRLAVTHVRVVQRDGGTTLLEARLETGRKHQIRVQLAERGHPVVGDSRYGSGGTGRSRLALHAASLSFVHPRTGKTLEFRSRAPAWLRAPGAPPPAKRPPPASYSGPRRRAPRRR